MEKKDKRKERWQSLMDRMTIHSSSMTTIKNDLTIDSEYSRADSHPSAKTTARPTLASTTKTNRSTPTIPSRLVDFLCVIRPDLETPQAPQHASCPTDILLQTRLGDCYPKAREDMDFPHHIHTFCIPDGCRISMKPKPPTLFTLVLTSGNGHRLYGAALTLYDETILSSHEIFEACKSHNGNQEPPTTRPKKKLKQQTSDENSVYYLPTCLVVISHHAHFDVFRKFLQQLYRIYQSGSSPLPLERYIANFVHDVPLPPLRSRVQWDCFTTDVVVNIQRPAPNELPLVNFSYQPLFSTLSLANVLVVWGLLLQESRIVLCSRHHSLLTPVAEALLSLLFPLEWHGLYIPVLPSGMQDVLDAPVPYLVGVDGKYLNDKAVQRPEGVVFVDLDEDVVHLGYDHNSQQRRIPDLPDRDILQLKVELEELTDQLYLLPSCGIKGRITTEDGKILDNSMREPYSQMTRLQDKQVGDKNHRHFILSHAETPFLSSFRQQTRTLQAHTDRLLAFAGQTYATPNPFLTGDRELEQKRFRIATQFYDLDEGDGQDENNKTFSSNAVRHAFLRFFISLLSRYKKFLNADSPSDHLFQQEAFLNDLRLSARNRQYVAEVVSTQMFERFIHESSRRRKPDRLVFFDEHITIERNQSAWPAAKQPTPFLNQSRWKIRQVFIPAATSALGLRKGCVYHYTQFPKLVDEEFVSSKRVDPSLCKSTLLCCGFLSWPLC